MKNVYVDFSNLSEKLKPLHGVNNGPKTNGFGYDTSKYFKEAGIPYSRLHDTEYPFGGGHVVDVCQIFRDFEADPENESAYDFRLTDLYLKFIKDCGTDIIYRLGVSIENNPYRYIKPLYIYPPGDALRWARICEHIIMHYNEGWANGFHMGIQYWEIWNEPESEAMWQGTGEQFYDFYAVSAGYLKRRFPELKIGGFGSIGFYEYTRIDQPCFCDEPYNSLIDYMRGFFRKAKEAAAPVDFFSFHLYSNDPEEFRIHARAARETAAQCGFPDAELILDEWNMEGISNVGSHIGAAHVAAVLTALQDSPVAIANYYEASPLMGWCGLFERAGYRVNPRPAYYSMLAYQKLYRLQKQAQTTAQSGLHTLAATDGDRSSVLISHYGEKECGIALHVKGLEKKALRKIRIYLTDETHVYEPVREEVTSASQFVLYLKVKGYAVLSIDLELCNEEMSETERDTIR